jgi:hypothetical protein
MKIKLERLIMRNDIIFKRSVQFRDENKNSWTVDFEVYKEESTRITVKHCKNLNKVSVFRYVELEVWVPGMLRSYNSSYRRTKETSGILEQIII